MDALNTLAAKVPPRRAQRFLEELLNLRADDPKAVERFIKSFEDILPKHVLFVREPYQPLLIERQPAMAVKALLKARRYLCEAWQAPTVLAREVTVLRLMGSYLQTADQPRDVDNKLVSYDASYWAEEAGSSIDAFFMVLQWTLHMVDRMRYCPNPGCPAPYFIARKRRQKYCSEICARPAQMEFKRRWWAEHGEARRKARKAKAKKLRTKRGK